MGTRVFTEKEKREIERYLPFTPDAHVRFTPDIYEGIPVEFRPVYLIRPARPEDRAEFLKVAKENEKNIEFNVSDLQARILGKHAVIGCENYREVKDFASPISWEPEKLKFLSEGIIQEIWEFAFSLLSGPRKGEREGLESLPPSTSEPSSVVAPVADVAQP